MENLSLPAISEKEKRDLVSSILVHPSFARKADTSRKVLAFLLERHLENPFAGPTQTEIYHGAWGSDINPASDKADVARGAVRRLRHLLAEYFNAVGVREPISLTVSAGGRNGYQLLFERRSDRSSSVTDWFWGAYLAEDSITHFGYVPDPDACGDLLDAIAPPDDDEVRLEENRLGRPYPVLRIYRHLATLLGPKRLEILPPSGDPGDVLSYAHNIFIGDDESFTHPKLRPGRFGFSRDDLGWSVADHFTLSMIRRANRTMVLNPTGTPSIFTDTGDREHVLLTRLTTERDLKEQTCLFARSGKSIARVAEYVTSAAGLLVIEANAVMRDATQRLRELWEGYDPTKGTRPTSIEYRGGAPFEFQILFSVATKPCQSHERDSQLEDVHIAACSVPPFEDKWHEVKGLGLTRG